MFDDLPKPKGNNEFPRNLEGMSIEELEEYIQELNSEAEKVKGDVAQKKASHDAAANVFKS